MERRQISEKSGKGKKDVKEEEVREEGDKEEKTAVTP